MAALEFQINLSGNFASELGKANAQLGKTEHGAHGAKEGVEAFELEIGKASGELGGFGLNLNALAKGGSLFTFDLAEGAGLVAEAFAKVIELGAKVIETAVEIGKEFVKTAAEEQDLEFAIRLNFGDNAEAINKIGEQFQERTRFNEEEIKKLILPLGQAGIKNTENIGKLVTAATDIAAFGNTGLAGAQTAVEALKNIQIKGAINKGTFKDLFLEQKVFYADLGKELGVSADTAAKMAKAGKIDTNRLLNFTLSEIAKRQGTPGELGTASEQSAKTLGGILKRLSDLPGDYLRKLASSPAVGSLNTFLDRLVMQLDPNGATGQRLIASIERITDRILGAFDSIDLGDTFDGMVNAVEKIGTAFADAWPHIKLFTQEVAVYVGWMWKAVEVTNKALAFGGIFKGLTPEQAPEFNRGAAEQAYKNSLYREAGLAGPLPQVPHMAEGGLVSRPTYALIGESGPEAVVPLDRMGGGGSFNFSGNVIINLPAGAEGGGSGMEMGTTAAQGFWAEMKRFLEATGYAVGAGTTT